MLDALVVGGGFYGAAIAVYLVVRRGLPRVMLVEQGPALLRQASLNNQARVHNGYHYPRSYTTAFRSHVNLPKFVADYPDAVRRDFTSVYAIAARNSKLTARQFTRFCAEIGARLEPAPQALRTLFEPRLVEDVFIAEEPIFDACVLARQLTRDLAAAGVEVRLNARVAAVARSAKDGAALEAAIEVDALRTTQTARLVFNCTYSGLNQLGGDFAATRTQLKHEITEMALVEPPRELSGLGVTVMDGPFFSLLPFPARGLHTLSHVRYTPHLQWLDRAGADPLVRLRDYPRQSRIDRMLRDAARYLPIVASSVPVDSLFEVKTVLARNEGDDGRPILCEEQADLPGCYSILGGKIDNIYDVLEKLDAELR